VTEMKTIIESWNKTMLEAQEQTPETKASLFRDLEDQAAQLISNINKAAQGDANLAQEAIQSLIVVFQNSLKGQ